jgi:cell division septation protein DedD
MDRKAVTPYFHQSPQPEAGWGVALVLLLLNLKTVEPAAAAVAVTAVMCLTTALANLIRMQEMAAQGVLPKAKGITAAAAQAAEAALQAAAVALPNLETPTAPVTVATAFLLQ